VKLYYKDPEILSLSTMITIPFSISSIYEKQNKLTKANLHFLHHMSEMDILVSINNVSSLDFPTEQRNIYVSQPPTANKHYHILLEIDSHVTSAKSQSLRHYSTSITPPRRTKQKTRIAKQEYPHFDNILPFQDHNTLILFYTNIYTIIIFNSPTTGSF
jgi:hypothetical protein